MTEREVSTHLLNSAGQCSECGCPFQAMAGNDVVATDGVAMWAMELEQLDLRLLYPDKSTPTTYSPCWLNRELAWAHRLQLEAEFRRWSP